MGQGLSRQKMAEFEGLVNKKLSKQEIKTYYKFFHEMFPGGEMDAEGFRRYIRAVDPDIPPDASTDHLFRAMDRNRDGHVTFKEYLLFQAIGAPSLTPIDPHDLIEIAFLMYDQDGDGYVTKDEMLECLLNVFRARGLDTDSPEVKETIQMRVENLLKLADQNHDGRITLAEIQEATKKDPSIVNLF
eukprot:TRINITY_DN931_c0_g1_i2.p1 TRINITY_DN931_c0_g1~~TRINITY_DN931_c0_g1_i2.p1  ORF type:complete len:187 (+),score=53.68 TRINITY_DN931_c0_g1_i2:122-682(+)